MVLTASDDMQYAFEGDELKERVVVRSAFTEVLVEGLETGKADLDQDGLIRLNELHDYVVQEFKNRKSPQRPRKWTFDAFDDIVLAHNPKLAEQLPSKLRDLIADEIMSGDADELGFEPAAKDSRLDIAARAGESPAAQRRVHMDVAVGDDFGAGADRRGDDEIGAARIDLGSGPDRLGYQQRFGCGGRRRTLRR